MTPEQDQVLRSLVGKTVPHVLRAEDVVAEAVAPDSPLHSLFTWDDSEAARKHRLQEASRLIRVIVHFEPRVQRTVRSFVSIARNRASGQSYEVTANVLDNPLRRDQLLNQALRELRGFQQRYQMLPELDSLHIAISEVVQDYEVQLNSHAAAG